MRLPGLFVTGTDTGVGKTAVAAAIARILTERGVKVGVLKPVATGARRSNGEAGPEDAEILREAVGGGIELDRICPIVFEEPLAPSVAARRAGIDLSLDAIREQTERSLDWWADRAQVVIVEGIGGLYCPLAEEATAADLAEALDFPVLIVGRKSLGTLNHVLLTVEGARIRGLRIAGIVLNQSEPPTGSIAEATNAFELAHRLENVAVLADLPRYDAVEDQTFLEILRTVDWLELFQPPRRVEPAAEPGDPVVLPRPPGDRDRFEIEDASRVVYHFGPSDDEVSASDALALLQSSSGSGEESGLALKPAGGLEPDPLLDVFAQGIGEPNLAGGRAIAAEPAPGKVLSVLDSDAGNNPNPWPELGRSHDERRPSRRTRSSRADQSSLGRVLLHSYASAMTLACAWLLWTNWKLSRQRPESAPAQTRPRASEALRVTPDGERGENSRVVEPPKPVPADRRVSLGQRLRIGSLEILPIEIRRDRVALVHDKFGGGTEKRPGGERALQLKLRLRNLSDSEIFAPLDEAFVRDPDAGTPDSFIEAGPNLRVYSFPLAIRSEWSIVGQTFRELRPGESFETAIVSAPDAFVDLPDDTPLLWRVRLRVGIASNEVVGVSFRKKDVKEPLEKNSSISEKRRRPEAR